MKDPLCQDAMALLHQRVVDLFHEEKPGIVLDVPAAGGRLAQRLARLDFAVVCGDIDPSPMRDGLRWIRLDLNQRWPCRDEGFDYVICTEGIEHLENPWHLVQEVKHVLKTGGKLFLSTPNILSIKSRLSNLLYGYPNYFNYMVEGDSRSNQELPVDHINPIGFLELRHILVRNGFSIVCVTTNRYQKRHSLLYWLIKVLLHTRGRSSGRDLARAEVRKLLLTNEILFGENLIIVAKKL